MVVVVAVAATRDRYRILRPTLRSTWTTEDSSGGGRAARARSPSSALIDLLRTILYGFEQDHAKGLVPPVIEKSQRNDRSDMHDSVWGSFVRVYETGQRLAHSSGLSSPSWRSSVSAPRRAAGDREAARAQSGAGVGGRRPAHRWLVCAHLGAGNLSANGLSFAWRLMIEAGVESVGRRILLWLTFHGKTSLSNPLEI